MEPYPNIQPSVQPVEGNSALIVCCLGEGPKVKSWEELGKGLCLPNHGRAIIHAGFRPSSVVPLRSPMFLTITPYPFLCK